MTSYFVLTLQCVVNRKRNRDGDECGPPFNMWINIVLYSLRASLVLLRKWTGEVSLKSGNPRSDEPYCGLEFLVRPCGICARKLIRGQRLIAFEREVRAFCSVTTDLTAIYANPLLHLDGDHLTKPTNGYGSHDYPSDALFTSDTAPIYVSAVSVGCLQRLPGSVDAIDSLKTAEAVERRVKELNRLGFNIEHYDALEFMEWSWEFSPGNVYGGSFSVLGAILPETGRVACRGYDEDTGLWAHPFVGDWAVRAEQVQTVPFRGKEISDILRSYTVNGVKCDRSLAYLAPDCFSHTAFTADSVVEFARRYAQAVQQHSLQRRVSRSGVDEGADADEYSSDQSLGGIDEEIGTVVLRVGWLFDVYDSKNAIEVLLVQFKARFAREL
ncbi:hypothetical protein B0H10DRAFT_1939192 [Mycena sp. CBHHK59/15]|nr:hypothetical protein B0H10DRAFT_1939192 [Mycena sp. CBHHK59/15]